MLDTSDYTFTYEYAIDEPTPEPAAAAPESTRSMHMLIARQIVSMTPSLQDVSDDLIDRVALLAAIESLLDAEMSIDEIQAKIDRWVGWAIGRGYPLAELPIALGRLFAETYSKKSRDCVILIE